MRNKRLVILKVNTLLFNKEQIESMRKQVKKQLRDNVISVDKSIDVKFVDYDGKEVEVVVVGKDEKVIAEKK